MSQNIVHVVNWEFVTGVARSCARRQDQRLMGHVLRESIIEAAAGEGDRGVAMGAIVDALSSAGYAPEDIELAIWALLGARLLTPNGFVCRMLQRKGSNGVKARVSRSYELLLVPWSPVDDRQLELSLGSGSNSDSDSDSGVGHKAAGDGQ